MVEVWAFLKLLGELYSLYKMIVKGIGPAADETTIRIRIDQLRDAIETLKEARTDHEKIAASRRITNYLSGI